MSIIEKLQREKRKKQENQVNRALMALKYSKEEPIDVTEMPVHELIDLIKELGVMPRDINPVRFAAMVKNIARSGF